LRQNETAKQISLAPSSVAAALEPLLLLGMSLPDGSGFSPPWTPTEDFYLAEGMLINRNDDIAFGHSLALPGLGTTLAASKPREACEEYVENIIEYMRSKRCPKRRPDELLRRIHDLRGVFGTTPTNFKRFSAAAKAAKEQEQEQTSAPGCSKRPQTAISTAASLSAAAASKRARHDAAAAADAGVPPSAAKQRTEASIGRGAAGSSSSCGGSGKGSDGGAGSSTPAACGTAAATASASRALPGGKDAAPARSSANGKGVSSERSGAQTPAALGGGDAAAAAAAASGGAIAPAATPNPGHTSASSSSAADSGAIAELGGSAQLSRRAAIAERGAAAAAARAPRSALYSASAVKEAKAAASRAHKEALAAGGFPKRLVTWARATVLETLNAPATRSTLLDAVHREGAHAPAFRELHALLERTVDGIENVSTLLVGPRGCGKHRLLSAVLRQMPTPDRGPEHEDEEEELAFHRVDLHALLVPDEPTALMAIASQLRVAHGGMTMRGSFCDGLRYLLHLLRRARPGCEGEGAVEAQGRPVLFVLHDFEQFTFRPKQTLVGFEAPTDLRPFLSLSYPLSSFSSLSSPLSPRSPLPPFLSLLCFPSSLSSHPPSLPPPPHACSSTPSST